MSELINIAAGRNNFHRQLLTTVSALALIGSVGIARADDADRPTVWIELGGQLQRMDNAEQDFAPSFISATPRPKPQTISLLSIEQPPRYSIGGEGKVSFEPKDSEWVFSASVLYGRANKTKHVRQQSYPVYKSHLFKPPSYLVTYVKNKYPHGGQFMDTKIKSEESHTVLDFQVGKDVGLGLFGSKGSSVFSLGVRFAQFASNSSISLSSNPDFHMKYGGAPPLKIYVTAPFHSNVASLVATRNFRGVGPSISWNASAPVVGNSQSAEIALDWGINASLLFGRQKAKIHHQSTAWYNNGGPGAHYATAVHHSPVHYTRARTVTVPNVGGFAGLSFLYSNAKVSFGYRGDFFFGAMDGGIDTARKENVGFYGPFASVSVGLGG